MEQTVPSREVMPAYFVSLGRDDIAKGITGALARFSSSGGLRNKAGYSPSPWSDWQSCANGALSEVAVMIWTGRNQELTCNTFKSEPDILPDLEVRWTARTEGLILRPGDAGILDRKFVLVTGSPIQFQIWGWCYGNIIKDKEAIKNGDILYTCPDPSRPPCWVVRKHRLTQTVPLS